MAQGRKILGFLFFKALAVADSVTSQCPYCGVGCGLELLPPAQPGRPVRRDGEGHPMWSARGDRAHPSSQGQVCIKGATVGETLAGGRLSQPLYRPFSGGSVPAHHLGQRL